MLIFSACSSHPAVSELNDAAAIPASVLPVNPLQWTVLSSSINRRAHTTSTMYANDTAFKFARSVSGTRYPEHAYLAFVTWAQQDDAHWFGGRIPAALKSVELIRFDVAGVPVYTRYEGTPLAAVPSQDTARAGYLLALPVQVMP